MQQQMNHQKSKKNHLSFSSYQVFQLIRKAQEYYMKDLCLNTKRFDSWAGLTVIEFYKIEEFITVIYHYDSRKSKFFVF